MKVVSSSNDEGSEELSAQAEDLSDAVSFFKIAGNKNNTTRTEFCKGES